MKPPEIPRWRSTNTTARDTISLRPRSSESLRHSSGTR
jgi:hypothetical protein